MPKNYTSTSPSEILIHNDGIYLSGAVLDNGTPVIMLSTEFPPNSPFEFIVFTASIQNLEELASWVFEILSNPKHRMAAQSETTNS